ncbi:MAG: protein kinase [Acidobacteria bacterium]|nr:protein kinase [Acidobacteriota bacterium]
MTAADGVLFCPRRGVNPGATQRLRKDTTKLLHSRLRTLVWLLLATSAASFGRFLLLGQVAGMAGTGFLIGASVVAALYLRPATRTTPQLRATTLAVFLAGLVGIGINTFLILGEALQAADYGFYHAQANRLPGIYLLLMLAYAIFIPAPWKQALVACALIVVGGIVPSLGLMWSYRGAFQAAGASIDRVEQVSFTLMMLLIGALFAVIGSHTIHGYRRAAAETDDAGMYRLLGKLGEGGMGEVWRAEHRMLARPAAIKIIRPELLGVSSAEDTATRRFTREARATAKLQSPNTVDLYDFGSTQDGIFFYVMEMLDGMDLEDMVKNFGPMRPARVVHLLTQAADSLQEAHNRGLTHRDIKPGNLHVGFYAGRADWVKVLDFGLVKASDEVEGQTALTMEGVTTGTPAYFPPEMARGAAAADARSDIYALAAVGYWMLTGELVFAGNTALEMVLQHVQETPLPVSQRTELPVPPALEAAIMAGLSKNPDERSQTMREFATMLANSDLARWTDAEALEWWRLHEPDVLGGAA